VQLYNEILIFLLSGRAINLLVITEARAKRMIKDKRKTAREK
jgi:hypothetical protein